MSFDRKKLLLYAVTDSGKKADRPLPERVESALKGGATCIQLREKELTGEALMKEAEQIRAYIVENKTSHYLYLISGTKRYYPYASLAAQALGFVNAEGGAYGIEAVYDDVLEGTAGRVVTTKTGSGTQMYNSYSEFIDAVDGYDLTLTIDATITPWLYQTIS